MFTFVSPTSIEIPVHDHTVYLDALREKADGQFPEENTGSIGENDDRRRGSRSSLRPATTLTYLWKHVE